MVFFKSTAGLTLAAAAGLSVALISQGIAAQATLSDYWLLEDDVARNPEQAALTTDFARAVQEPARAFAGTRQGPVRIVIVYPGLQVSDYWRRSVSSFRARLEEIGLDFTIEEQFTKPETEVRLQSRLLAEAMAEPPDYLVFTLDALRHRTMIERLMAQGKTKLILQNITTPLRDFGDAQPFLYVGFDHAVGSRMLAERYKAEIPEAGRYAIFYGPRGYVSQMRGGVFLNEMSDRPDIELLASYYVGFDRGRSYKAAMELLREHPDLDFIYACSTDIAFGIIDALKETGRLGSVTVNGWGGGEAELAAIEAGELNFTVMRMNDDNGVAMAEAIRLDLQDAGASIPTVYSGEFRLVDQNTGRDQLSALRAHAFRYSE